MDQISGFARRLATSKGGGTSQGILLPARLSLEQRISPTAYAAAKVHNIQLAVEQFQDLPIAPGMIFSFWHVVGRPIARRGFLPGRSLLGGRIVADHGGGLCQLSGLIYHLALLGGLKILERHPHSRDIYQEAERYTPLGADATVAFGFKDLRLLNCHAFPVAFRFLLTDSSILGSICAPSAIEPCSVDFVRVHEGTRHVVVETRRSLPGHRIHIEANSRYERLNDCAIRDEP